MSDAYSLNTEDFNYEEDPGSHKIEESRPSGSHSHSEGVFKDDAGGNATLCKDDAAMEEADSQINSSPEVLASSELVEGSDTLSGVLQEEVVPSEGLAKQNEDVECDSNVGGSVCHPSK